MAGIIDRKYPSDKLSDKNLAQALSVDLTNGLMMANGRFMITKSIGKGSFGEIF